MVQRHKSNPTFNASAAGVDGQAGMALMIDLQLGCVQYLGRDEAKAYLDHMGEVLLGLRQKMPVAWVTIGDVENDLVPVEEKNASPRDKAECEALGFLGDGKNRDLFEDFLSKHGPRKDEVVFRKRGFSALSDDEPALRNYLNEQRIDKISISGGMAGYCVGSTVCDAVRSGWETKAMPDTIIGWPGGERAANYLQEGATWLGEDHAKRMKEMYGDVMARADLSSSDYGLAKRDMVNGTNPAVSRFAR